MIRVSRERSCATSSPPVGRSAPHRQAEGGATSGSVQRAMTCLLRLLARRTNAVHTFAGFGGESEGLRFVWAHGFPNPEVGGEWVRDRLARIAESLEGEGAFEGVEDGPPAGEGDSGKVTLRAVPIHGGGKGVGVLGAVWPGPDALPPGGDRLLSPQRRVPPRPDGHRNMGNEPDPRHPLFHDPIPRRRPRRAGRLHPGPLGPGGDLRHGRGERNGNRRGDGPALRIPGPAPSRRPASRHRKSGDPRRDLAEAHEAHRRRNHLDQGAPGARRGDRALLGQSGPCDPRDPLPSRAARRLRISDGPRGGRDPPGGPDHRHRRRVRRPDERAPLPGRLRPQRRHRHHPERERHRVRSEGGGGAGPDFPEGRTHHGADHPLRSDRPCDPGGGAHRTGAARARRPCAVGARHSPQGHPADPGSEQLGGRHRPR